MKSLFFIKPDFLLSVFLLIFSCFPLYHSRAYLLADTSRALPSDHTAPLYLPRIEAVRAVTLGYEHFISTLLWFRTLHYFGSQFEAKEAMPWFSHMCDLVTELDPGGRHVFEFCGTLVSWIAREPQRCISLLSKGIEHDPSYWRYYYLRGFTYWYFLEDMEAARADFEYASRLPDAPVFLSSLASRLISASGDVENAIAFLRAGIETTEDETAKKALEERLHLAYVSRDISLLDKVTEKYRLDTGRYPESIEVLLSDNYLRSMPIDPWGDPYQYDAAGAEFSSANGRKGLNFPGKTARTGIASQEGWVSNE
jgi:tetratricopeptide (TPR) repeat protein